MSDTTRYHIEHTSHYRYQLPTRGSVMALCLQPHQDAQQQLHTFELTIEPAAVLSRERDSFGNCYHYFSIHRRHHAVKIALCAEVELRPLPSLPSSLKTEAWQEVRRWHNSFTYWDFMRPSALTSASAVLTTFMRDNSIAPTRDPLSSLQQLNAKLFECLQYLPGSTSVESPIEQILTTRQGVCQDYTHVMLAIARRWGIPARYVSGYLYMTGQQYEQVASNATHAWVECLLPTLGWVGFDPTNCSNRDARHVRIAVGRDYRDVPPTRGTRQGGGNTDLDVVVKVQRL